MQNSINLQDLFLNQVRKDKVPVSIYVSDGRQLKGIVKGFDNFTIIIESDDKLRLIYKHAISTIIPVKAVNVFEETEQK